MTTPAPKPKRGGKRAGAGRKRRSAPVVAFTIRVDVPTAERFKAHCDGYLMSQAKLFSKLVWLYPEAP